MEPANKKQKVELPDWLAQRAVNLAKELSTLAPGTKYVITLTVREDVFFYTCTPMSEVRH